MVHGVDDWAQRVPLELCAQQRIVDDVEQHLAANFRNQCLDCGEQQELGVGYAGFF